MGSLSSVDPVTKLEIHELLSRFCWSLDHDDAEEWGQLYTSDATFSVPGIGEHHGREEILKVPAFFRQKSEGAWRHHFTNIIVDRAASGRELKVRALLTIRDCMDAAPVASVDCVIIARRTDHWRIGSFEGTKVCKAGAPARNEATERAAALH
jgi:limonene-1,2-epoxide hydrolase